MTGNIIRKAGTSMKARDARTMNRNETRGGGAEPGPREMKAELLSVIGEEAAALLRDEVAAGLASYAAALMRVEISSTSERISPTICLRCGSGSFSSSRCWRACIWL